MRPSPFRLRPGAIWQGIGGLARCVRNGLSPCGLCPKAIWPIVRGLAEAWGGAEPGEVDTDWALAKIGWARGCGFFLMLVGR